MGLASVGNPHSFAKISARTRLRTQLNPAKESCEAHSRHLRKLQKAASAAAEKLATGRGRRRKRNTAKLKRTATKKKNCVNRVSLVGG